MNELPDGFVIRLAEHVRVRDGGRTLIGGAPLRVSHLSQAAPKLFLGETLTVESSVSRLLAESLLDSGIAEPVVGLLDNIDLDEVTCVIPVRDRATSLDRLLSSIDGLPHVVVVDDCSAAPELIAEVCRRHDAQLIALHRNLGPAGARNAGLREVTTPYVLFVDSDVVITIRAITTLLKHFHDPNVGAVAPRILGLDPGTGWIGRYEAARSSLDLGTQSAVVHPRSRVAWVPSAVLLARTEAVGEGFDATMMVGEDVDLVWRLTDFGWRVRYEAEVIARHDHRTTILPWMKRKAFYGLGADPLAKRHGRKVAPAVLGPASVGIAVAALAQRRWSLPIIGLLTGVTAARLTKNLERNERPTRLGTELALKGTASSLSQLMALILRHWWPAAALGSCISSRVRRAVVIAAVVDTVVEYQRLKPESNVLEFTVARRIDDLAYGAGVWWGAFASRSPSALTPDFSARGRH